MSSGARPASAGDDAFAWFRQKRWCAQYHPWAVAVLERILTPHLGPGASVLDLFCGAGAITKALAALGYYVTGVDRSGALVDLARAEAPEAFFLEADARAFRMPLAFHGAVCAFEGLNRIIAPPELQTVFENVWASLQPRGVFVFDMLLEDAFLARWAETRAVVEDEHAFFIRAGYDPLERLGRTDFTVFRLAGGEWQRCDSALIERCYAPAEVRRMLLAASFGAVRVVDAVRDLGIPGSPGEGRAFFVALKSPGATRRRAARSSIPVRSPAPSEARRRKEVPARREPERK